MALSEQQQREEAQRSALNAQRYRKQTLQQAVRGNIMKDTQETDQNNDIPEESAHRSRLAMMKAGAIKKANKEAGGVVGASAGGVVGSIIPFIGTGVGIFVGRYIGKKAGITGIIIFVVLMILFSLVIMIAIIKGMCDSLDPLEKGFEYLTTNICPSFK